jgi:hypothetical protein
MRRPSTDPGRRVSQSLRPGATKGVWSTLFETLASAGGPPVQVLIDASAVKAHRCASGSNGGAEPSHWPLAWWSDHEDPRAHGPTLPTARLPADRWSSRGLHRGRAPPGAAASLSASAWRQGYDSDAIRRQVEAAGAAPNIPPKANRVCKPCFSPVLYRSRIAMRLATASPPNSSPPSAPLRPSATGCESEP